MTVSYQSAAWACVAIGIALAALLQGLPFTFRDRRRELRLVILFCSVFTVVYASISCLRYHQMAYGLWDFGVYDIAVREMARFKGFMISYDGMYQEHFNPLILFWIPFYWVWDSPYVLLIGQSAQMGAAGIPLYFCCRRMLKAPGWPLLIVAMYLLNPYVSRFILYECHMGSFYPLLFFSAWLALSHRKHGLFLVLLFGSVLAKESFCVVTLSTGLYLCSRRKHLRLGLACLALTAVFTLFILYVWFPHIVPLSYHHGERFPTLLGNSVSATIGNAMRIAGVMLSSDSLSVTLSLLIPFAFLPLLSWRVFLLLLLPVVAIQLCSLHSPQHLLMSHYSDVLNPLLPIASTLALARWRRLSGWPPRARRMAVALCVSLPVTAHVMFCELPHVKYHSYIPVYRVNRQLGVLSIPFHRWQLIYPRAAVFHEIKDAIPTHLTVCAQNNLAVFFARHKAVRHIRDPRDPDVYVFDLKTFDGYDPVEVFRGLISKVASDPGYACVYEQDGFLVFYRKSLFQKL